MPIGTLHVFDTISGDQPRGERKSATFFVMFPANETSISVEWDFPFTVCLISETLPSGGTVLRVTKAQKIAVGRANDIELLVAARVDFVVFASHAHIWLMLIIIGYH